MMDALYYVFIAIKDSLCRVICRTFPDGSHYTQKTTKRRPHGFCRFMKKHKKINDILKYEYNFTSLIPFKSINL